ncbi:hypothetical protein DNG35_09825 [Mesonia sp. K7]|nr:hypothetical protein DNG35_09825 [Mesonia sp. K7]
MLVNVVLYGARLSGKGKAYRFFWSYLLAIFCLQLVMKAYSSQSINNHFLSTYYLFLQFGLLSAFFYDLFVPIKRKISRLVSYLSLAVVLGLLIQYLIHPEQYYTFNSLGFLVTTVVLITYTVLYLYEMLSQKLPFYVVCIGLFIYLISSSLIFVSATSLIALNNKINTLIWDINALLFMVYQLLILWEWKQSFFQKKTG